MNTYIYICVCVCIYSCYPEDRQMSNLNRRLKSMFWKKGLGEGGRPHAPPLYVIRSVGVV